MNDPIIAPVYQYYAKDPVFRYKYSVQPDVKEGWAKDGTAFFAFGKRQPGVVPVYEYYAEKPKYRFRYSTNPNIKEGWIKAGIGFYASTTLVENTILVYEYYVEKPEYRFFYSTNPDIKDGWENAGAVFYVFAATPATPVPAPIGGRYVIGQYFEKIEQYFGPYLTESTRQQGDETLTERTYDSAGLRHVLPKLPVDAKFKVIFINGQAQEIVLGPALGDEFRDLAWQAFNPNQEERSTYFEYVFGYRPSSFELVPGHDGGGHEGFFVNAFCLGGGIQIIYTSSLAGVGPLSLSYTRACEPLQA